MNLTLIREWHCTHPHTTGYHALLYYRSLPAYPFLHLSTLPPQGFWTLDVVGVVLHVLLAGSR